MALEQSAEQTWNVAKPLDDTVACIVEQLREGNKHYIDGYSSVPFTAGIVVPGKTYEIRPSRTMIVGADPLVIRVSKLSDTQTKVDLFSVRGFGDGMVKQHIGPCI